MESNSVGNRTSDRQNRKNREANYEYDCKQNWTTRCVLLQINHNHKKKKKRKQPNVINAIC